MASDSDEELEMFPYDPFSTGVTPFQYDDPLSNSTILNAVLLDDIAKVQQLINTGKNLNVLDNNGNSALHFAIRKKSNRMVKLLLKHKVDVNQQNLMGYTPLLYALELHSVNLIIIQLLEVGCDVNIKNNNEDTALHLAVTHSSPEIIQLLIERGADVNAQDGSLFTPLHQAAYQNKLSAVCILLYYNADTTMLCCHNLTPFMYSLMKQNSFEITKVLFPYCDDFSHVTVLGETIIGLAVKHNNPIVVELLQSDLDYDYQYADVIELLYYAVNHHYFDLFKAFLVRYSKNCTFERAYSYILRSLFFRDFHSIYSWSDYFYLLVEICYEKPYDACCILKNIFLYFFKSGTDSNNRKYILWALLSLGVEVDLNDLLECCSIFGNREELEILYQCYICDPIVSKQLILTSCLPIQYFHILLTNSACNLKSLLEKSYFLNFRNKPNVSYLGYMSFSSNALHQLLSISNDAKLSLSDEIALLPNVPSLLELSRNASAIQIISIYNIKKHYEFFYVINKANLPKCVKDLLLFRRPVYCV